MKNSISASQFAALGFARLRQAACQHLSKEGRFVDPLRFATHLCTGFGRDRLAKRSRAWAGRQKADKPKC